MQVTEPSLASCSISSGVTTTRANGKKTGITRSEVGAALVRLTAALDLRDKAAERLAHHVQVAAAAWRELVDLSANAALLSRAFPIRSAQ